MQIDRIDRLIQYALVVAGSEDFGQRKIGPIHMLKYVYLGDLAFAEANQGQTYTGAPWRFYHYGPWTEEVFKRIEPAVVAIGADKQTYVSRRFENDAIRYELVNDNLRREIERSLPFEVERIIRQAVHEFGQDTAGLLHHVYRTKPMLNATPNEALDFETVVPDESKSVPPSEPPSEEVSLSKTAQKRRREHLSNVRERIQEKLRSRQTDRRRIPPPFSPDLTSREDVGCRR